MWIIVPWCICVAIIIYFINLREIFKKIVFNLYFFLFMSNFLLVMLIWPFPLLFGRAVRNIKVWSILLKYCTILLGIKWEFRDRNVLTKDRGAVIVANHQSSFDLIGMCSIWEIADKMVLIAKKDFQLVALLRVLTYFGGMMFIDRKDPKTAYKQLEAAAKLINKKIKIWMYPEGTRNYDYTKFKPFKKGAFITAIASQAPIIPVVFSPYYFIDRKNYKLNKGRVIIQCLEEVPTTGLTMNDVPELTERVRKIMLEAYKKLSDEVMIDNTKADDEENYVKFVKHSRSAIN